jgi:hydroxyacyl-ACP dehydratase HTD2-like protein with hotdog domain
MAIDRRHIGFSLPPFTVFIEPARLALFAKAIGETDPQYANSIAPPTFLKAIDGENNSSRVILEALDVDLKRVLHVQQEFNYGEPARVGDSITVERTVLDIYDKRQGELEFIVIESVLTNAAQLIVGRIRQLVMVRNPLQRDDK